jgi:hypothetical protein
LWHGSSILTRKDLKISTEAELPLDDWSWAGVGARRDAGAALMLSRLLLYGVYESVSFCVKVLRPDRVVLER